ncbi:glycosyltransferase [Candidatus Gottesmanbacteria bacterium]|nr:glycosyltransferase [Candidatus Gottesmanbacteria bacterium]
MIDISVILPTYNEKGNIIPLIKSIFRTALFAKAKYEAIVVDDSSPDGTAVVCKHAFRGKRSVRVFVRKKERGLASAIWFGVQKARGKQVVVMDTDLSHDPSVIPKLGEACRKATLAIGSRYITGGGMENSRRYWLSRFFNIYLRLLFHLPVTDFLSGFFCVDRKFILSLGNSDAGLFAGYGDYFMRLITKVKQAGGTFYEIPVYYRNRPYGESKSRFIPMFISYTIASLKLRGTDELPKR